MKGLRISDLSQGLPKGSELVAILSDPGAYLMLKNDARLQFVIGDRGIRPAYFDSMNTLGKFIHGIPGVDGFTLQLKPGKLPSCSPT